MKNFLELKAFGLLVTVINSSLVFSQQQIPNPAFESWEEIRAEVFEPMNWNSIKNTDGGMATNRMV